MLTLKQAKKGFTIIELLIVIAIIVILAGLVLTNINGAQAKARDTNRITDIQSITKSLEVYHNENGAYPETFDATDDGTGTYLPGIQEDALLDERGGDSIEFVTAAADQGAALTAAEAAADDDTDGTSAYAYAPHTCSGGNCNGFAISTFLETEDDPQTEVSLNN